MTWVYDQSNGDLFHNGVFLGTGYSGKGKTFEEGRNNGEKEAIVAVGPIPRGEWKIGKAYDKPNTGPISIKLTPVGHDAHGRSGFFIHGDNLQHNASIGCIILTRALRLEINASMDKRLTVIA